MGVRVKLEGALCGRHGMGVDASMRSRVFF